MTFVNNFIHIYYIINLNGKDRNPSGYFMSHNVTSCEMKQLKGEKFFSLFGQGIEGNIYITYI